MRPIVRKVRPFGKIAADVWSLALVSLVLREVRLDIIQARFPFGDPALDIVNPDFEPCVIVGAARPIDDKEDVERVQHGHDSSLKARCTADIERLRIIVCHLTSLMCDQISWRRVFADGF